MNIRISIWAIGNIVYVNLRPTNGSPKACCRWKDDDPVTMILIIGKVSTMILRLSPIFSIFWASSIKRSEYHWRVFHKSVLDWLENIFATSLSSSGYREYFFLWKRFNEDLFHKRSFSYLTRSIEHQYFSWNQMSYQLLSQMAFDPHSTIDYSLILRKSYFFASIYDKYIQIHVVTSLFRNYYEM